MILSNKRITKALIRLVRVVGDIFHFYSNLNRIFCKQIVEAHIRVHILNVGSISIAVLMVCLISPNAAYFSTAGSKFHCRQQAEVTQKRKKSTVILLG